MVVGSNPTGRTIKIARELKILSDWRVLMFVVSRMEMGNIYFLTLQESARELGTTYQVVRRSLSNLCGMGLMIRLSFASTKRSAYIANPHVVWRGSFPARRRLIMAIKNRSLVVEFFDFAEVVNGKRKVTKKVRLRHDEEARKRVASHLQLVVNNK